MSLKLEQLNEKDIPALLLLAQEIGWGYNQKNWQQFMKWGSVLGHRTEEGRPISSAVMIQYGDSLRWLTSLIVSPRFQRQGFASSLWSALVQDLNLIRGKK
jgi:ribosomal protein S18 acetylase RimI-like enzyme